MKLHGLIAEFDEPSKVLAAARAAYESGFRKMDAYTPFPVEDLAETLGMKKTGVPLIALICGILGGATGYGMQFFSATIHYPLNVGGRPLHSWPAFVPITFELTVLFGAVGAVLGMLALNGLPRLNHPIFDTPFFAERNQSHFYLCIESGDSRFDEDTTAKFLRSLTPLNVWEAPE
jgi:hypothetical protein